MGFVHGSESVWARPAILRGVCAVVLLLRVSLRDGNIVSGLVTEYAAGAYFVLGRMVEPTRAFFGNVVCA